MNRKSEKDTLEKLAKERAEWVSPESASPRNISGPRFTKEDFIPVEGIFRYRERQAELDNPKYGLCAGTDFDFNVILAYNALFFTSAFAVARSLVDYFK